VACIAVHGCLFRVKFLFELPVAGDTPAHVHLDRLIDRVHRSDVSMTRHASYTGGDVGGMHEVNITRLLVDTHPGNWLMGQIVVAKQFDLRMGNRDVFVATPANLLRRQVGNSRGCSGPMAIGARNVQLCDMHMMIKRDGLCRPRCTDPVGLSIVRHLGPIERSSQQSTEQKVRSAE
jgi:hypothetical protein